MSKLSNPSDTPEAISTHENPSDISSPIFSNVDVNDSAVTSESQHNQGRTERVSDNTGTLKEYANQNPSAGSPPKADLPEPPQPWQLVLEELQEIRQRITVLDKIERSTETHTQQLSGVVQRTSDLESAVETATARIKSLSDEVSTP